MEESIKESRKKMDLDGEDEDRYSYQENQEDDKELDDYQGSQAGYGKVKY